MRLLQWGVLLALSFLLVACRSGGVRLPESPLLRTLERKSGLIAYIGTDGNIYTIDQGGGNRKAITTDASPSSSQGSDIRYYQFPTWSPDSQRLAFVKVSGRQQAFEGAAIYVARRDGTNLSEVYSSRDEIPFYLYWSPDGARVAFLSAAPTRPSMRLQMVSVQGGDVQTLDTGQPYYWDWKPDGRRLLVHVGSVASRQTPPKISFLNVQDGVREEGLDLQPFSFQAPAWSPNGRQLLLAGKDSWGAEGLLLLDEAGRVEKTLATITGTVAFGWSPDGRKIAYIASDSVRAVGSLGPLTVLDPQNPASAKTSEETRVMAFFWAPDSRKLVYFVPVLVGPQAEGQSRSGQQQEPVLLLSLYVMDATSGQSHRLATFRPTDEFLNILPYFDQYHRSSTLWSPDSRRLVLSALTGEGQPGIWVLDTTNTLGPRYITEGVLAFWSWR